MKIAELIILAIVRLEQTGAHAEGAVTASHLINRLRDRLVDEPLALNEFESRLAAAGWHEHPDHDDFAVRVVGLENYTVDGTFPRLIRALVPRGVLDADYEIAMPTAPGPGDVARGAG